MMIFLYYLSSIMFFIFSILMFMFSMVVMMMNLNLFLNWMCISFNSVNLNMYMYIDWITLMFIFTVLIISSMILMYSSEYMSHDMYIKRFYYLVLLFIMSMLMMILCPNMVSILIGWDGLGLVSYCLVIYYQSFSSYNSGMLTVLMNRVGDVLIIISISLMFIMGTWGFLQLNFCFFMLMFFIVLAGFTKSAQFPFSSWLPAAMAAPTPVSSLVHSSTLVTAGVYLMIRFHYLLYKNDLLMMYLMLSGLLTMMMAGFSANFEYDIKKIIAYSTLSQLGLMMMIFSMKYWELAYFHLVIHAMFKSMMFMCSGMIIHSMLNFQDIRFMGKLINYLPFTSLIFMVSNLALCGLPFMSGFYSKDKILEVMFMGNFSLIIYMFLMISTGLTVSYSSRLLYYLMNFNSKFISMMNLKDLKFMNFSMLILMFMTLMFGEMLNWILFNNIENIYLLDKEKLSVLILCILFFYVGMINFKVKSFMKFNLLNSLFFGKMWFLYNLNKIIILYPLMFGKFYYKLFDKGWSEYYLKDSVYLYSMKLKVLDKLNLNYLIFLILCLMYLLLMIFMI